MDTVEILGVNVHRVSLSDAADFLVQKMDEEDPQVCVFTPNAEIIMRAWEDEDFKDVLNQGTLVVPDGIGVVKAAKKLGKPVPERVGGYDLVLSVFDRIRNTDKSVYLFGGKPGVAEEAAKKLTGIRIAGFHDGYYQSDQEIIEDIKEKKPDFLLVCLGMKKQEEWILAHKHELNAKVMIGAGGSIDVLAGSVKRAPDFFIKLGLEWLYRLLCQPKRIIRMMALPKFVITVQFHGKKQK